MDSSNKLLTSLQAKMEQDGSDRDALHQWIRLPHRFMASVDMDGGGQGGKSRRGVQTDELRDKKALSKVQRNLAFLLGYSEQAFNIPPYKLRYAFSWNSGHIISNPDHQIRSHFLWEVLLE